MWKWKMFRRESLGDLVQSAIDETELRLKSAQEEFEAAKINLALARARHSVLINAQREVVGSPDLEV